jgi:predicted N-acetyltransferase YhbS
MAMIAIRTERPNDQTAREALLDRAYGPARFAKPSQKLRAGRAPAEGLSFVAADRGAIVGTLRLWPVTAGLARDALLLGPLAVDPASRSRGIGAALMRKALEAARARGHRAVLLMGDAAYYGRFGFSAVATGKLRMPGAFDPARLLAFELAPGALAGAAGPIRPAGALVSPPQTRIGRKSVNKPAARAA